MEDVYSLARDVSSANIDNQWAHILITLIAMVAVYFHARIKKSGELKEVNANFVKVLDQQKVLTKETGEIKQALDKGSISYQIKLNAYHGKSIAAIEVIYKEVLKVRYSAETVGNFSLEENKHAFRRSVENFRRIMREQRIWLPKDLVEHLKEITSSLDSKVEAFISAEKRLDSPKRLSDDRVSKYMEVEESFYDYISGDIEDVFELLVKRIENVLKV